MSESHNRTKRQGRKKTSLLQRKRSVISDLKGTALGKGDLSLAALFEVRETLLPMKGTGNEHRGRASTTAAAKQKMLATRRKTKRRKMREAVEGIIERKKAAGSHAGVEPARGGHARAADVALPLVAASGLLDGAFRRLDAGLDRCHMTLANDFGWVEKVAWDDTLVEHTVEKLGVPGVKVHRGHAVYRITEEGRAARSWATWVRALVALGHRPPAIGYMGAHIPKWIRGEPVELWIRKYNAPKGTGYFSGDPEEMIWPDLGRYNLEELSEAD